MEDHGAGYGPEMPEDQEEAWQGDAEMQPETDGPEGHQEGGAPGEDPGQEEPEQGTEDPGRDPEEGSLEGQPEDGADEDPAEETGEPDPETVSGNGIAISGDVVIFPDGCDLSALGGTPADTESIVQAAEKQADIMAAGFTCTSFLLGLLAGAMIIAGFRLRRV